MVEKKTGEPVKIEPVVHDFIYGGFGHESTLLNGINIKGIINYSSIHKIKNMHGVKKGYMIIIGEKNE